MMVLVTYDVNVETPEGRRRLTAGSEDLPRPWPARAEIGV